MKRLTSLEDELHRGLGARRLGRPIAWYEQVESTMDLARREAEAGAAEGTTIAAGEQLRGRGRKGDAWFSPAGSGLWASLVLRPRGPIADAPELTVLAARAVKETLESDFGVAATIKAPNDVLVDGRKICGVLAESASQAGRDVLDWLVLGVGLDVKAEFPPALASIATSLHRHVKTPPTIPQLLARFLERFEPLYESFSKR